MAAIIRHLERKDVPTVAGFIHELTPNVVDPRNLPIRLRRLTRENKSEYDSFEYMVVDNDGVVVAFGGLTWNPAPSKGLVGWIEEVFVDKSHRGHGFGKTLMKKLIEMAGIKGITRLRLMVSNPIAKEMYACLGFTDRNDDLMELKLAA